ncbi:MAG: hypothetical protein U0795_09530 [Pirellulales bacterium]
MVKTPNVTTQLGQSRLQTTSTCNGRKRSAESSDQLEYRCAEYEYEPDERGSPQNIRGYPCHPWSKPDVTTQLGQSRLQTTSTCNGRKRSAESPDQLEYRCAEYEYRCAEYEYEPDERGSPQNIRGYPCHPWSKTPNFTTQLGQSRLQTTSTCNGRKRSAESPDQLEYRCAEYEYRCAEYEYEPDERGSPQNIRGYPCHPWSKTPNFTTQLGQSRLQTTSTCNGRKCRAESSYQLEYRCAEYEYRGAEYEYEQDERGSPQNIRVYPCHPWSKPRTSPLSSANRDFKPPRPATAENVAPSRLTSSSTAALSTSTSRTNEDHHKTSVDIRAIRGQNPERHHSARPIATSNHLDLERPKT